MVTESVVIYLMDEVTRLYALYKNMKIRLSVPTNLIDDAKATGPRVVDMTLITGSLTELAINQRWFDV